MSANWITSCPEPDSWRLRLAAYSAPSDSGCIVWVGSRDRSGYGKFRFRQAGIRRMTGAHRAAWLAIVGPIPDGLVIDHLCRNRSCVNTAHMELVTPAENTSRSELVGKSKGARSWDTDGACLHGHERTPENTHTYTSYQGYVTRICLPCRRQRSRAWKEKVRKAA